MSARLAATRTRPTKSMSTAAVLSAYPIRRGLPPGLADLDCAHRSAQISGASMHGTSTANWDQLHSDYLKLTYLRIASAPIGQDVACDLG